MKWTVPLLSVLLLILCTACSETDEHLLKLAESGNVNAQFKLGYRHLQTHGILRDYSEAMKWFRLAAEQGDAQACYHLGYMHELGRGVPQSYSEAYVWFSLSANFGSKIAIRSRDFTAEELSSEELAAAQKRVGQ